MDILICPLCRSVLELQQINLTQAIYICLDLKCSYPFDQKCILVERPLKEINSTLSRSSNNKNKKLKTEKHPDFFPNNDTKTKQPTDDKFELDAYLSQALEDFDLPPDNPIPVHENRLINLPGNNEQILNNNSYANNNPNQQLLNFNSYNDYNGQPDLNDSQYVMNLEEIFEEFV